MSTFFLRKGRPGTEEQRTSTHFFSELKSGNLSGSTKMEPFAPRKPLRGVPVVAQWLANLTSIHEDAGSILALLSGLRTSHCHELWCRSKMQPGSHVAVAAV